MGRYAADLHALPLHAWGILPAPLMAVYGFSFQDSNPFASLVFYWEALNRQVSEHSQGSLGWAGLREAWLYR